MERKSVVFTEEVSGTDVYLVQHIDLAICVFNHAMTVTYSTSSVRVRATETFEVLPILGPREPQSAPIGIP